jgi:hypothetical protein
MLEVTFIPPGSVIIAWGAPPEVPGGVTATPVNETVPVAAGE